MSKFKTLSLLLTSSFFVVAHANEEGQVISKKEALKLSSLSNSQSGRKQALPRSKGHQHFTGKIIGAGVRMRTQPDLESPIVRDVKKDELIVVVGESNDFYEVAPPMDTRAFVFRSFVLDNTVEGNRVNVRLSPDLESPVIGHLNTGDKVQGRISDRNSKWLEIDPPQNCKFYIAKEFIEYAGGADLKQIRDRRKLDLDKLVETTYYAGDVEMQKPFEEIDFERISSKFKQIVNEYKDFPAEAEKAATKLAALQETYLQRKLAYLEEKTERLASNEEEVKEAPVATQKKTSVINPSDRMKAWEPLEQALFAAWQTMHHAKTMDDFYEAEKNGAEVITGMIDHYSDPVKNKPGSHMVTLRDVPQAYIYSTHLDLDHYVGKKVSLVVAPRPNNSFAFPAYYVFEVN